MLNINKIESDINSKNLQSTDVSKIIGVKYTTTIGRREKGNWTPNDVEKLAEYFERPIAYYFDKDEKELNHEPAKYDIKCKECTAKQKEIDALKLALEAKEELLDVYRNKKDQQRCG